MYEAHYGLAELPFRIAPDPRFYVDATPHRAAIRGLLDGLGRGEDFTPLVGDFGTGKTTVARRLLEEADPARHVVAELPHVRVQGDELLDRIAEALGLRRPKAAPPMGVLIPQFEALAREGRDAWLLVDEADSLSVGVLNRLRKLSSVRVEGRAALHVFLVGRAMPAALDELQRVGRPLNIGAPVRMQPLDAAGTHAYIRERLLRAGWTGRPVFDLRTTAEIHARCQGSPGRVNRLCGRILLHQFMQGRHEIDVEVVCAVDELLHSEMGGEPAAMALPPPPPPPPRSPSPPPAAAPASPRAVAPTPRLSTASRDLDLDIDVPSTSLPPVLVPARRADPPRRSPRTPVPERRKRVAPPQASGLARGAAVVALLVCGGLLWHTISRVAGVYSAQSRFAAAAAAFSKQEDVAAVHDVAAPVLASASQAGLAAAAPDLVMMAQQAIAQAPTGAGPASAPAVLQASVTDVAPAASAAGHDVHARRAPPAHRTRTASAIKPAAPDPATTATCALGSATVGPCVRSQPQ